MASNGDLEDVIKKIKPHKWDFTTKKRDQMDIYHARLISWSLTLKNRH